MDLPQGASGMPGIIVPRKTVLEIVKLMDGEDGDVEVSLSSAKIRFKVGNLVLTSKLIDGTFPDYERVIPRNNDKILEADTKQFAEAVDRVSTISFEKSRAVKLSLSEGKLGLVVNNPDSGSAEEEIPVSYDRDPIEIGFNSRYLLDVAAQVKAETMRFEFNDSGSPTVIRDPKDAQSLFVLMPMRV
jgi:DNA polymerase III subunit beta